MTSEGRKRPRGRATASRAGGAEWASNARKLLERAPQFDALANAAAGQAPKLSDSQGEFLDDFSSRLAAGVAEGDDTSQPAAAPAVADPAGARARPKEET